MTPLSPALARKIAHTIATEIVAQPAQVQAAVALLDEGATVPFIARYRKEVTGGLDDTQLRNLETRLTYLREMEKRGIATGIYVLQLHNEANRMSRRVNVH